VGSLIPLRRASWRAANPQWMLYGLITLLGIVFVINIALGGVKIPSIHVLSIFVNSVFAEILPVSNQNTMIVTQIRLPRAIAAVLVGGVLAITGAMLQGLFRNPLADPGLVGVSSGAALAAVTTIVLAHNLIGIVDPTFLRYLLPVSAFVGGFGSTYLIYYISMQDGSAKVATMLLAGIAINAIAIAIVGGLIYISDDQQMRDLVFWQMGSFGGITWSLLLPCIPLLILPMVAARWLVRPLNALSLGEDEAEHLGHNITLTTHIVICAVATGVGAAVAISGIIGFVGLIVPHLIRLISGVDHRNLLIQSALLGATILLIADLFARTVAVPAELPIGLVTGALGGPFFLWLLITSKKKLLS